MIITMLLITLFSFSIVGALHLLLLVLDIQGPAEIRIDTKNRNK